MASRRASKRARAASDAKSGADPTDSHALVSEETFAVARTRNAYWPWSPDRPLSPREIKIGFAMLAVLFGISEGALGFIDQVQGPLLGSVGTGPNSATAEADQKISVTGVTVRSAIWAVTLIFTPYILDILGGPRNGLNVCLFTWASCSVLFILVWLLDSDEMKWAASILNGALSGVTAPLAFTGAEIYTGRVAALLARAEFANEKGEKGEKGGAPAQLGMTKLELVIARRRREGELVDRLVGVLFGIQGVMNILFAIASAVGTFDDVTSVVTLHALIAFSCILFLAAFVSLLVPQVPEQTSVSGEGEGQRAESMSVLQRLLSVFMVLAEYRFMAGYAIVGWFFFTSWSSGYFDNYLSSGQCLYANPPAGLGVGKTVQLSFAGQAVYILGTILIPMTIGPKWWQFKGYCVLMVIANLIYASSTALAWAYNQRGELCNSQGVYTGVDILYMLGYCVYNVTSVAAVTSWFSGARAVFLPAALAARELCNQLGNAAENVYLGSFLTAAGGNAAPALSVGLNGFAAFNIVIAHLVSSRINGPRAKPGVSGKRGEVELAEDVPATEAAEEAVAVDGAELEREETIIAEALTMRPLGFKAKQA